MNSTTDFEKLLKDSQHHCDLDQNVSILRKTDAFAVVPIDRLKILASLSSRKKYFRNTFLFHQHDRDPHGYIMIDGKVQLYRHYEDKSYMLQELKPYDFFGGLALIADIKRLFSARAVTDVTCLVIDRESFSKFIVNFPEVAVRVVEIMVKRIVSMQEKLLQMQVVECRYE